MNRTLQLLRARQLLTGRHNLAIHAVPTVTGHWGWATTCHTCALTRSGIEDNHHAALTAAHHIIGPRDRHTLASPTRIKDNHLRDRLRAANHPAIPNWDGLYQARLPSALYGDGYTVATDGSYDHKRHAGSWAFITNTGWCRYGPVTIAADVDPRAAELAAVRHALVFYPPDSAITLLIDNVIVAGLIQRLQNTINSRRRVHQRVIPSWADRTTVGHIRDRLRLITVRVQWTKTKTNMLHNFADTLTLLAQGQQARTRAWRPRDLCPVQISCCVTPL